VIDNNNLVCVCGCEHVNKLVDGWGYAIRGVWGLDIRDFDVEGWVGWSGGCGAWELRKFTV